MSILTIILLNTGLAAALVAVLAAVMLIPKRLNVASPASGRYGVPRRPAVSRIGARFLPGIRRRGLGNAGCNRLRIPFGRRPRLDIPVARRWPPRRT